MHWRIISSTSLLVIVQCIVYLSLWRMDVRIKGIRLNTDMLLSQFMDLKICSKNQLTRTVRKLSCIIFLCFTDISLMPLWLILSLQSDHFPISTSLFSHCYEIINCNMKYFLGHLPTKTVPSVINQSINQSINDFNSIAANMLDWLQ